MVKEFDMNSEKSDAGSGNWRNTPLVVSTLLLINSKF